MTIQKSDELGDLFCALAQLQGKIENAKKDKSGYKNNYKYADLNQYIELSKELLAEHGLCVLQIPGAMEIVEVTKEVKEIHVIETTEKVYNKTTQSYEYHELKTPQDVIKLHKISVPKQTITTWIGHKSGQFISDSMEILVEKMAGSSWGQSTGGAISFARRYARSGTLGMSQEDNDNMLSKNDTEKVYSTSYYKSPKIDKERVNYLKELLKDDPERLKKILLWASEQQKQSLNNIEDMSIDVYTAAINILINEKIKNEELDKKDASLIDEKQAAFISRILTPERLNKILSDYNLTKLEDMNVKDYHNEYNKLRLEIDEPKEVFEKLKVS